MDSIAYQIGIVDSSGCMSTSNIAMLEPDILPPPLVVIDSASVDPVTGQIIIGWSSTALDVEGYVISVYNTLNLGWDPVDTVFGTSSYTDLVGLLSITDSISVFAYDSCGRKGSFAAGHSVMQLSADLDTCAGEATLKWTPYYIWTTGVADYDVYISQDGGPFIYEASTTGTEYVYAGLNRWTSYCYLVRANDGLGAKTSTSNVMCAYANIGAVQPEQFVLTVDARDSVKNHLQWNEDASWSANLISAYNIFRNNDGGMYSLVGSVPFGTTSYEDLLDPITDFITGDGDFCYYVVPTKVSFNLYGCVSISDTVCVTQFPKFVVPNTFTPNGDGRNDVFLPVKNFVKADDFLMLIYNRWGQQIFETTDVTEGWDGLVKGFPVQHDAYVYYVTFVIKGDVPVTRASTVLLMR